MAADFSSAVCFADVAAAGSREARFSEDPFANLNPALENPLHIAAVRRCESKAEGGLPAGLPASPGGPSFVQEPAAVLQRVPIWGKAGPCLLFAGAPFSRSRFFLFSFFILISRREETHLGLRGARAATGLPRPPCLGRRRCPHMAVGSRPGPG